MGGLVADGSQEYATPSACPRRDGGVPKKDLAPRLNSKRFRVRGSGSVKRGQAFKRHILTKKTTKNKRQLRGTEGVHSTNMASVKAMLPYA